MSNQSNNDPGVLLVVLEEYRNHRIPRLHALREKVDQGNTLSDVELEFLGRMIEDANRNLSSSLCQSELQAFCTQVVSLYSEITEKALDNEKGL